MWNGTWRRILINNRQDISDSLPYTPDVWFVWILVETVDSGFEACPALREKALVVTDCGAQYLGVLFGFLTLGLTYLLCSCLATPGDWMRLCKRCQNLFLAFIFKPSWKNSFAVVSLMDNGGLNHSQRWFPLWFHVQNTLTCLLFALGDPSLFACQHWLLEQRRSPGLWSFQLWQILDMVHTAFALMLSSGFFLFLEYLSIFRN